MSPALSRTLLLTTLLLLVLVTLLGWGLVRRQALDDASSEQALSAIEATLGYGNTTALSERAHPALLAVMARPALESYLASIPARLGDLQAITAISGGTDAGLLPLPGKAVTASYEIKLRFSNGEATAAVAMTLDSDRWLFTDYTVDSPLLYD